MVRVILNDGREIRYSNAFSFRPVGGRADLAIYSGKTAPADGSGLEDLVAIVNVGQYTLIDDGGSEAVQK